MGYAQAATRVYQFVPDNVVLLANAEFSRKISVGNQWQRLRLGFLAAVNPNLTAQNIVNCLCYFGMSSSTGPGISAYNVQNFIGVSLIGLPGAGADLTYTVATYPNPYYTRSSEQLFAKYGTAVTTATSDANSIVWSPARVGNSRRFPYILDITRPAGGGGTYTMTLYALTTAAHAAVDHRPDHFFSCLDFLGTPISNGQTLTVCINAKTISWNEANGPLDTITLYWNKVNFPLELSAIGAVLIDNTIYPESNSGFVEVWGAGTAAPFAPDVYSYGTLLSGTLTPTYASGAIVSAGSAANLAAYDIVSGTSTGPADNFESYAVGTVDSGLTLTGGLGWDGPGFVYQW